jgi:hypothetical protein
MQLWSYINNMTHYRFSFSYTQYRESIVIEKQRGFDRMQQYQKLLVLHIMSIKLTVNIYIYNYFIAHWLQFSRVRRQIRSQFLN